MSFALRGKVRRFLRSNWGDLDLALSDVEQALQLYLKTLLLELFGVRTKMHEVLEHLRYWKIKGELRYSSPEGYGRRA